MMVLRTKNASEGMRKTKDRSTAIENKQDEREKGGGEEDGKNDKWKEAREMSAGEREANEFEQIGEK